MCTPPDRYLYLNGGRASHGRINAAMNYRFEIATWVKSFDLPDQEIQYCEYSAD